LACVKDASEKNLALSPLASPYFPQPIHALKLIEDPFLILA